METEGRKFCVIPYSIRYFEANSSQWITFGFNCDHRDCTCGLIAKPFSSPAIHIEMPILMGKLALHITSKLLINSFTTCVSHVVITINSLVTAKMMAVLQSPIFTLVLKLPTSYLLQGVGLVLPSVCLWLCVCLFF